MKVVIDATIPDDLLRDWLVHLGSFSKAHTKCEFNIMVQTGPNVTVEDAIKTIDESGLKVVSAVKFNPDKPT